MFTGPSQESADESLAYVTNCAGFSCGVHELKNDGLLCLYRAADISPADNLNYRLPSSLELLSTQQTLQHYLLNMGRGGFNGGSAAVQEPRTDTVYYFTAQESIDDVTQAPLEVEILKRARIVLSGERLKNEKGGVQHEFGYVLEITYPEPEQKEPTKGLSKLVRAVLSSKKAQPNYYNRWVAASTLLDESPEGREFVRKYHLDRPEESRPWGFDRITAGTFRNGLWLFE